MTKVKPIFREFLIDDSGRNKLLMKTTAKTKTLYLKLQTEANKKRKLGVVTISTRTLKIKRTREEHLLHTANAYGFNEFLLSNTKTFDTVSLSDNYSDWKIPKDYILQHGSPLWFKTQGFEKQLFLSLEQITQFLVPAKNRL